MSNRAARRIKRKEAKTSRLRDVGTVNVPEGLRLPLLVVVSVLIHAIVLILFNVLPGLLPKSGKEVVVYSIEIASEPGPMGGGGESPEVKKEPEKPEEPEPEPEPVVEPEPEIPSPEPETESEPAKPVEKPEASKPKPEASKPKPAKPVPRGPGVGPVGGGKEGTEGPVTVPGGIPFPFPEYLKQVEVKTKSTWDRSRANYRTRRELAVEVSFSIDRRGRVKDARVTKGSRNPLVDRFALGVIKDSSPYNRLPDGYEGGTLGVVYRFTIPPN